MFGWLKRLFVRDRLEPEPEPAPTNIELNALPFEIVAVAGADAHTQLGKLRSETVAAAILGDWNDFSLLRQLIAEADDDLNEILLATDRLVISEWCQESISEDEDYWEMPAAEWPDQTLPSIEPSLHMTLLGKKPKRTVYIGLFETADTWKIPAILRFGGWDE